MAEYSDYVEARNFVAGALDGTEKMAGSKGGSAWGWTTQQIANLANAMAQASFVDRETPSGAIDDANAVYTLATAPIVGSEHVYLNGFLITQGVDYTISGVTITFITPPETGDTLRVSYRK